MNTDTLTKDVKKWYNRIGRATHSLWKRNAPKQLLRQLYNFMQQHDIISWQQTILTFTKHGGIIPMCKICSNPCLFKESNSNYRCTCSNIQCQKQYKTILMKHMLSISHTPENKTRRVKGRIGYRHSEEVKRRISETNKRTWTSQYKAECVKRNVESGAYKRAGESISKRILEGKFTPNRHNSLTKKKIYAYAKLSIEYRSMWEATFHSCNPLLEYEVTRIPYIHDGRKRTYIVDFTDEQTKTLFEVKPFSRTTDNKTLSKITAAQNWCAHNGYQFCLIDETWFAKNSSKVLSSINVSKCSYQELKRIQKLCHS